MDYRFGIAIALVGLAALAFISIWHFLLPALIFVGVIPLVLVAIAWVRSSNSGVTFGVTRGQLSRCLVRVAAMFALVAPITWGIGFGPPVSQVTFLALVGIGLGGTFLAVRQLPMSWAVVSAPVILVACVWVGVASLYVAYQAGWQDLEWHVEEPGDISDPEVQLALLLFFGTIVAVLPGVAVGVFSQAYKHRRRRAAA